MRVVLRWHANVLERLLLHHGLRNGHRVLELAVGSWYVGRIAGIYHFGVGRVVQHHGRGHWRHRVLQRAELSLAVRVDTVD